MEESGDNEFGKQFHDLLGKMQRSPEVVDMKPISDLLFQELRAQFDPDPLLDGDRERWKYGIELLRCCLASLSILEFYGDLSLAVEKCQSLHALLRRVLSDDSAAGPPLSPPSRVAILEVFIEGLMSNSQLRHLFAITDSADSTGEEKLFLNSCGFHDLQVVLELCCHHFINSLAVCSYPGSGKVWSDTPQLDLCSSLALIGLGNMFVFPDTLQVHLISLASRCISSGNSDALEMLIIAFELARNLYLSYMSAFNTAKNVVDGTKSLPSYSLKKLPLSSCSRGVTCRKLDDCAGKLIVESCNKMMSGSGTDMLSGLILFVEERQTAVTEQFREDVAYVIVQILLCYLADSDRKLSTESNRMISRQDMYCIAATLELMASAMGKILQMTGGSSMSKGTSALEELICCFQQYEENWVVGKNLLGAAGAEHVRNESGMSMLAHFSTLLLYSLSMRLEFLYKPCISVMMAAANFIRFKDGNLNAFSFFLSSSHQQHIPAGSASLSPRDENGQGLCFRRSSVRIASCLKNMQETLLSEENSLLACDGQRMARKCGGRAIAECMPEFKESSDWDDLLDFIVCKEGKDYAGWLRNRSRFRQWTQEKKAVHRKRQRKAKKAIHRKKRQKL